MKTYINIYYEDGKQYFIQYVSAYRMGSYWHAGDLSDQRAKRFKRGSYTRHVNSFVDTPANRRKHNVVEVIDCRWEKYK